MKFKGTIGMTVAGVAAGAVNGLLGAGGGMILVPLLTWLTTLDEKEIFPASVSIILPVCIVSLCIVLRQTSMPWSTAWPYLIGSAAGGIFSGLLSKNIPTTWLHRALGLLILWGGIRYLC